MEAVDVLEDQRHQQDDQNERHGGSGVLQGDVGDDFLQQFVEVLQRDDLERVMFAAEQISVKRHHVVVGFTFEELKLVIEVFNLFQIQSFAQQLHQIEHNVGGPLQQVDLLGKVDVAHMLRRYQYAGGEFINRLGNLVKGVGQFLDVLALQRGDEGGIDGGADFSCDLLILLTGIRKLIDRRRLVKRLAQLDERLHARARLLRAGLQQREELIFFA